MENLRSGLDALGAESRVLSAAQADDVDASVKRLSEYAAPSPLDLLAIRIYGRLSARLGQQHARAGELLRGVTRLRREWPCELVEVEESFGHAHALSEAGIPTVVRLHGPWFLNAEALGIPRDDDFAFRDAHERRGICGAHGLSSPSSDVLARVRAHYQIELPDAEVIPNPCARVDEHARFRLEHADRQLILFVGRFDRHKGGDLMLDAFARIASDLPDVRLAFVGPDRGLRSAEGRTISLADYLRMRMPGCARGRVEVMGPLPPAQISALRRRALVTVVPSRYETFGMTVVEAMAHGSPLVTSGAGGIGEIVRDGATARVFHNGSAESLAEVLRHLVARPDEAAALGARGLAECRTRFAPEVVARQMLDFYERVLERLTARPRHSGVIARGAGSRLRDGLGAAARRARRSVKPDGRRAG